MFIWIQNIVFILARELKKYAAMFMAFTVASFFNFMFPYFSYFLLKTLVIFSSSEM